MVPYKRAQDALRTTAQCDWISNGDTIKILAVKKSIILVSVLSVVAMMLVSCSSSGTPQSINENPPATQQTNRGTDQLPLGRTYETDQLRAGQESE